MGKGSNAHSLQEPDVGATSALKQPLVNALGPRRRSLCDQGHAHLVQSLALYPLRS
jgi:hypothetical protein